MPTLETLQETIGSCREYINDEGDRCGEPIDYVLWGKLIPAEGLGPRCYDCAAKHVGHRFLADATAAIIDLRRLAWAIDEAKSR